MKHSTQYISTFVALTSGVLSAITQTYPIVLTTTTPFSPDAPGLNVSNYPACTQECFELETSGLEICPTDGTDINCPCGSKFRSASAACQAVACDDADYQKTQTLGLDLCSPLYAANKTLATEVTEAIAQATALALSTIKAGNPTALTDFPQCYQDCIPRGLAAGGCSGVDDVECVCKCEAVDAASGDCEIAGCSQEDLSVGIYKVLALCSSVGGLYPKDPAACKAPPPSTGAATSVVQQPGSAVVQQPGSAVVQQPGSAVVQQPGSAVVQQPGSAVVQQPASGVKQPGKMRKRYAREML